MLNRNVKLFLSLLRSFADPRPPYTGVANIISMSKDKFNRNYFTVSLPGGKRIECVPGKECTTMLTIFLQTHSPLIFCRSTTIIDSQREL